MANNFPNTFAAAYPSAALADLDANFAQLCAASTSTVSLAGAALVGFIQSGTGAVATDSQAKQREMPISPEDFGCVLDGVTDDTAAWLKCRTASDSTGRPIRFPYKKTMLTDSFTIAAGGIVPPGIDLNGSTIKPIASATGVFVTIQNPHTDEPTFYFRGGIIDANSICTIPLKINGSQQCDYGPLQCKGGTSHGIQLAGASGYGIYGNKFSLLQSTGNGGAGFDLKSTGAAYYIGANDWSGLVSLNNTSYGIDADYASADFHSAWIEGNGAVGVNIDHSLHLAFHGGHNESNNSPDASFAGTSNSKGVAVLQMRTLGTITGFTSAASTGNIFLPATAVSGTPAFSFDGTNLLLTGGVSLAGGLALDGLTVIDNFIRFKSSAIGSLGLASTGYLQLDPTKVQLRAQKPLAIAAAAVSQATGELGLGNATQTTVGSAGGASALPATPTGYLKIYIGTTQYVIPYYAQA